MRYLRALTMSLPCLAAFLLVGAHAAAALDAPPHLRDARKLVTDLRGSSENVYGGGRRHIDWDPAHCRARTVCSSFVTLLLEHVYGWTDRDFKTWMSTTDPQAGDYYDAIDQKKGFLKIVHVSALRPGDILAIKYTDHHLSSNGVEDTGHVLIVSEAPQAIKSIKPLEPGTTQYTVSVIDSSASGHGDDDTRYQPGAGLTGGIGQGVFRIYADRDDRIAGYTWSATPRSPFFTAPNRELVAGRLKKAELAEAGGTRPEPFRDLGKK